jgi:hypothetical protein
MILDLDRLRDKQPRLYEVVLNHTSVSSGTHDLDLSGLPPAIRFELAEESLKQEWKESSAPQSTSPPSETPPAAPTETLRPWQLPLNATSAQIRNASFLVRKDLAMRQHEAAVREKRRVLGSHSVKFP